MALFHETVAGRKYYEVSVPRAVKALETIAAQLIEINTKLSSLERKDKNANNIQRENNDFTQTYSK